MSIRYWLLLAASAVSLTTCTTNGDKREEASQATSAASPGSVSAPDTLAASVAGAPHLPAAVSSVPAASGTVIPTADTSHTNDVQHRSVDGNSTVGRAHYRQRVPTTLADAPTIGEEEGTMGADSAATAELRRFLLSGLPPMQQFVVRPGRDTMLIGRQGTQVLIPANVWDLGADSSAVVQLEVQEFYTTADMVLAGLSTASGPQLLETGGMLHIAATANGQPVQLRPGRYVHLRMPARERQPGMQLFQGVEAGPGHLVDWQVPAVLVPPAIAAASQPAFKDFRGRRNFRARKFSKKKKRLKMGKGWMESTEPEFVTGEKGFRKSLASLINYPAATRARLRRGRRMSKDERLALRLASEEYKERILRIVSVDFVVDSTGAVSDAEIPASADAALATSIKSALRQLPLWEPAMFSAGGQRDSITPGEATRKVVLYFGESGRVVVVPQDWNLEKTARQRQTSFEHERINQIRAKDLAERRRADSLYAAHPRYYDSLRVVQQARAAAELERMRTQFTDTSRAAITQNGFYNELSAQGLRWINCDRYLGPGPLITYGVNTGRTGAIVTLLFRGFKSVMGGEQVTPAKFVFKKVPLGKMVTVLAMRRENGITYLSARRSVVGLAALSGFDFHPVTMDELRAELERLN